MQVTPTELRRIAYSLAHHMARSPNDVDDLAQEALWAAEEAVRGKTSPLHRRREEPAKPYAFFKTAMQRRILNYYNGKKRTGAKEDNGHDLRLLSEICPQVLAPDYVEHATFLDQYLHAVESAHGPQCRLIAEHLLSGVDARIHERIGSPKHDTTHRVLCQQLGIPRPVWSRQVDIIRAFTRAWMKMHDFRITV